MPVARNRLTRTDGEPGSRNNHYDSAEHRNRLRVVSADALFIVFLDRLLVLEEISRRKTEVRSEGMDVHRPTNVDRLKHLHTNTLVEPVENNFKRDQQPHLEQVCLSENRSESYHTCSCSEISDHESRDIKVDCVEIVLKDLMPERDNQHRDLEGPGREQEVEANCRPAEGLEENH